MLLGVKPGVFCARLLAFLVLAYVLWIPVAPLYTQGLAAVTRVFLHLTEIGSGSPYGYVTQMAVRPTMEGRPGIFFQHALYPEVRDGIPPEWVQANLVLLIPLMLAVPAVSYRQRFVRLGWAVGLTVLLQVLDITVTVKYVYATTPPAGFAYSDLAREIYGFTAAFAQGMDTQLFPFVIWAGIHFNQLLRRERTPKAPSTSPPTTARPLPRRKRKAVRKLADDKAA